MSLIYTYVDLDNIIQETTDGVLNYAGNWNGSASYFQDDVVLYNDSRYIALTANGSNVPPVTAVRDTKWSVLTLVSSGTAFTTGSEATSAYSLAYAAYNIAVYGTTTADSAYAIAVYGTTIAESAYSLANYAISISGTGGGGDGGLAQYALETAWVGTLAGDQAYDVAQDAYRIAVQGTLACSVLVDSILTTVDGHVVVNSSGNVVTSGGP
ncbi:MAG: hypothetical protein ACYSUV_01925 [Planctomycetota bacterium]|jgi:hypothetical protein